MFSREKSVEYALKWAYSRNPNYYDFTNLGGDCTNFISQCLHYGNIPMNYDIYGWYYVSLNKRAPSWTGVDEFWNFGINNESNFGIKLKQCLLNELELADVIQLYNGINYYHTLLVTKIENGIYVTAHDTNAVNMPLYYYSYKDFRCAKVVNN